MQLAVFTFFNFFIFVTFRFVFHFERSEAFCLKAKVGWIWSLCVRTYVRPSPAVSRERLEILTSGLQHVVVLDDTSRPFFVVFEIFEF